MLVEEIIKDISKGILKWYDFKKNSHILLLGENQKSLKELLLEDGLQVVCASVAETQTIEFLQEYCMKFDYIISIKVLESCYEPEKILELWHQLLAKNGKLLLGMNNRLGVRFFCGDRDPYTERSFDGIESYRRSGTLKREEFSGACYDKAEIEEMLDAGGWKTHKFYSVLPDLEHPQLIYADGYLPKEDLGIRYFPMYHYPDSVFLEEEHLYTGLIKNGMFHAIANTYFIECAPNGEFSNVNHVTISMDRGKKDAMLTIIREDGLVEKRAVYPEGEQRLIELLQNDKDLRSRGIKTVKAELQQNRYVMPYVDDEVAQVYLRRLIRSDLKQFIAEVDKFRDLILQSSEIVEPDREDGQGIILKKGYLDMVPLNCFYVDGEYVFFDQEFCEENYPANVIITRMIDHLYMGDFEMEEILPIEFFLKRYGLKQELERWRKMEADYFSKLLKKRELRSYHERYRRNVQVVNTNRQRINYSAGEYQRLFVDLFHNTENKKLLIFGSGNFTKKFLVQFGKKHPVDMILDNNSQKWGDMLEGIPIVSPDVLNDMNPDEYKVIICIKSYLSVAKQLLNMGVKNYGIYDVNIEYPRELPQKQAALKETGEEKPKKYHIGYIAGVFDLFHVGHLNMFKRAKQQCDYLIVGVVTDEGVQKYKKKEPFIPFEERIEVVRSCRYVDEAVEIPLNYGGTRDAYRLYHFDCQFSGSDYVDNPEWLGEKTFLEKNGADMVFFPYTEGTSSTKIKEMIEKALM